MHICFELAAGEWDSWEEKEPWNIPQECERDRESCETLLLTLSSEETIWFLQKQSLRDNKMHWLMSRVLDHLPGFAFISTTKVDQRDWRMWCQQFNACASDIWSLLPQITFSLHCRQNIPYKHAAWSCPKYNYVPDYLLWGQETFQIIFRSTMLPFHLFYRRWWQEFG